ncbi:hypothetical protein [Patulibacter minatonensis]|uniref:hypothetical protein n=1 Tax=Patulibacter minatonensis TaxID=298163 RepID=UPI00047B585A|nr:hypothetical protein [Patulibacter minatonensis]
MFGRRKKTKDAGRAAADAGERLPPTDPDPDLPVLNRAEAAALGDRVVAVFAEEGVPATYAAGIVHAEDGARYGLHNLSLLVAGLGAAERDVVVRDHVSALLDDSPLPTGSAAFEALVVQLWPTEAIPDGPPPGAPEVLPGITAIAALDLPTKVHQFLEDEHLEPYGGWEIVEPAARENLRRMPLPHHQVLQADDAESQDVPGPLSPEVFFLAPDGRREQITTGEGDERSIRVDGAFADAFAELGLLEDADDEDGTTRED